MDEKKEVGECGPNWCGKPNPIDGRPTACRNCPLSGDRWI